MPEYKNKPEHPAAADLEAEAAAADPRRAPGFEAMGYDAQVQALSPQQRDSGLGGGPAAQGDQEPASLRRFGAVWRTFMVAIGDRANPENEKHVELLNDRAIDLVDAASAFYEWSDEQCGKAARACTKAIKAFFQWRREAQKLGLNKAMLKTARHANRRIVAVRDELRTAAR